MDQVADACGEEVTAHDVEDVLVDNVHCPPQEMLEAFATVLSIDASVIVDAAKKGGCTNLGPSDTAPPGF